MKKVFISYSHEDEELKIKFEKHLSGLKRNKIIDVWTDEKILIGEKWDEKIKNELLESDIVIFLISPDFLNSEYINEIEIKKTISRHNNKEVLIAPIFLRPCDFESSILAEFQGLPKGVKFITSWKDEDAGFLEVIKGLKKLIKEFSPTKKAILETASFDKRYNIIDCDTPPDISTWVGRSKELEILDSMHFKVIFITGIGGQGKSSLATKYLYNQKNRSYYESWDWRDFKEEGNRLKTKLLEIIDRYSDVDISSLDLRDAEYEDIVSYFFKVIGNKKILFVFDNIDAYIDYELFKPINGFKQLINYALTRQHNCKFIFTCRPFIKKADVGFYQIKLSGLCYESSVLLLNKYPISIKQEKKETLYKKLHEVTNGHPLWLNILGAQAVAGTDKLEKFISNISDHTNFNEDDITNILSEQIIGDLWNSLNDKQQKLLLCISELIKAEDVDKLAKIVENVLNYNQFNKALKGLKAFNLVVTKTKESSGKEEIELHPLVKSYVKNRYRISERSKYISVIIDYYNKVTYVLKKRLSGNESLTFYENWTKKVELAINKEDFVLALSFLEEIKDPILTAGYFEEYYRIALLLFNKIDFIKIYNNGTPCFISQIRSFVDLSSEINEFESSRKVLDSFKSVITDKGNDYIIYCKLESKFYWNKLDNHESIKWGEEGLKLIKSGKVGTDVDIEHTLNLAKRDTSEPKLVNEALVFFLKGKSIEDLVKESIDKNLSGEYYGNLGRCYYYLHEYEYAFNLYLKSFLLVYNQKSSMRFVNRGFISYWLGQLLEAKNEKNIACLFYVNCINYWKRYSPHRALKVEDEIKALKNGNSDIEDLFNLDDETVENKCKQYVKEHLV